jgi:hypothetical protein
VGRRSRRREQAPAPRLPPALHEAPDGEQQLELRTVLTPKTRAEYARVAGGSPLSQEDAWQRAVEFLFERLAVSWTIHGVRTDGQRELLARLRAATPDERRFVRDALRAHCAEWFPDVEAP